MEDHQQDVYDGMTLSDPAGTVRANSKLPDIDRKFPYGEI